MFTVFQYPISKQDDRRVYAWGHGSHGALGEMKIVQKKEFLFMTKPKRISFAELHKVTDIACGYGFTIYAVHAADKNIVYGSGINTDSQLGTRGGSD